MDDKEKDIEKIEEDCEIRYSGLATVVEPNKQKGYSQKWKTNKRGKLISGYF